MEEKDIQAWTHWKGVRSKRLFLIVDVHTDKVILMEVKDYAPGEQRIFEPLLKMDFLLLVNDKKQLEKVNPRI